MTSFNVLRLIVLYLSAATIAFPSEAAVQRSHDPFVITSDWGGKIRSYIEQLAEIDRTGRRVEIRGTCASSCTLFLAARDVCVTPDARLGFHGPRYLRKKMPKHVFEFYSVLMSNHYPPAISEWFMSDARFKIRGLKVVRGANMMQHGIRAC
ncbi:hypothetical protein [Citreimonas salinaria]|uniref:Uncharacterized protein n=1 Tax=Citreimonas salinaria TaxID=321339 RepID=A0A1H3P4Z2_9RHOB|nr:hypothetical protein [Citreimonas salinaria]SDY96053.1 hypothetical protein SAMN05444340_1491 [Citreimonas salinaria]